MENHTPKISVIVPVYNVEQYLPRCIDSILAQTFTDFELLLIDDGSTDNSGKICDEYAEKDKRIRVWHKENGGVSSARNVGLDNSCGDWICFVDSDDAVESNWLSCYAESFDADLIVQGFQIIYSNGTKYTATQDEKLKKDEQRYELVYLLAKAGMLNPPWNKCYRSKIIKQNCMKFAEKISLSEDLIFVLDFLTYSKSLHVRNNFTYIYNRPNSTLSLKYYNPLLLVNWKSKILHSAIRFVNWDYNNKVYKILATQEFSWFCFYVTPHFKKMTHKERRNIYSFMRTMYFIVSFRKMQLNRIPFILLPIPLRLFDVVISLYSYLIYNVIKRF